MAQGTATVKIMTSAGKQAKQQRVVGTTANAFTYIALGIGNTADAALADTALTSEVTSGSMARVAVTPTVVNGVITWSYTFTNNTASAIVVSEVGILNAASAGTLLLHITLGTASFFTVAVNDTFIVNITDAE